MSDKLLAVMCATFCITLAVIITLQFRPLYYWEIEYLELEKRAGLSKEEIKANYDAIIDYNSLNSEEKLVLPTLSLSQNASIHFQEVKEIFKKVYYLCIATFILSLIFIFFKIRVRKWAFLKLTAILNIALPAVLGIAIVLNWDSFFVAFHKIFFRNDFWIFNPVQDPVIRILPEEFFLHSALLLVTIIFISSALCGIAYRAIKNKI